MNFGVLKPINFSLVLPHNPEWVDQNVLYDPLGSQKWVQSDFGTIRMTMRSQFLTLGGSESPWTFPSKSEKFGQKFLRDPPVIEAKNKKKVLKN